MERITEYQDERWKERARQIRELDGNKCAICGAKGLLHVHHLSYPPAPFHLWDSFDEEMVTLCPECHKLVHQSWKRIKLDSNRCVRDFESPYEEDEQWPTEGNRQEFLKRLKAARRGEKACCANCHMVDVFEDVTLYCPILAGGFHPVEPDQTACRYYEQRTCQNCMHFVPDSDGSGEGHCSQIESNGDPFRWWEGCSMGCDGDLWKFKPLKR